ncbi:MvaI/BcnI family restriction endonuclease, partial [Roseinatronobacter thiooxidans]
IHRISSDSGSVRLTDEDGTVAASWSYRKLLNHWQSKHALAAYVPSDKRGPPPEYRYSPRATLYVGTDFIRLLKAFAAGAVYLDPALKATFVDGVLGPVHRRSQFRIRHADMDQLYERRIDLPEP